MIIGLFLPSDPEPWRPWWRRSYQRIRRKCKSWKLHSQSCDVPVEAPRVPVPITAALIKVSINSRCVRSGGRRVFTIFKSRWKWRARRAIFFYYCFARSRALFCEIPLGGPLILSSFIIRISPELRPDKSWHVIRICILAFLFFCFIRLMSPISILQAEYWAGIYGNWLSSPRSACDNISQIN